MALAILSGYSEPTYDDWKIPVVKEKSIEIIDNSMKCNCYAFVKKVYFPNLPITTDILNNLKKEVGDVAVFYYPKSGLYHYAKVLESDGYTFKIDEANYSHCRLTQRELTLDYPQLIGFWSS